MAGRTRAWMAALVVLLAGGSALADGFPDRPIRIIVPFSAGGPADVVARIIGPRLGELLGQTVIVDDRGGADGIVGSDLVAKAAPDGYTLLLTPNSHVLHPGTYASLPYDTETAFTPISLVVAAQYILVVNPTLPVHSVAELIAYAKEHPGKLDYASAGAGGPTHMTAELFKMAAGIDMVHVPYKGGGPGLIAVVANEAQVMMGPILSTMPAVKTGQVRGLGTTGEHRTPAAPDLPTIGETLPGFSAVSWYGVLGPAHMPPELTEKLSAAFDEVVHEKPIAERFAAIGGQPCGGAAELLAAQIREDIPKWAKVAKAAHIHID